MQYRLAILALAGLAAAQSSSSSAAAAQTSSGASSPVEQCISACPAGDVNCQAQCVNVPYPNESQVNANLACARNCNQGDGSPAQTEAYGKCLAQCASQHYYTSGASLAAGSGSAPTAVPAGGAANSGSNASPTDTGAGAASTGASGTAAAGSNSGMSTQASGSATGASGTQTPASSTSSSAGAAAATLMPVGMMGLAMAVLAL